MGSKSRTVIYKLVVRHYLFFFLLCLYTCKVRGCIRSVQSAYIALCELGMGRLIAIHGYRGFKAQGSVHRRQFAYHSFFLDFFK